ncbi:MAG: hypothetical protein ABIP68_06755 [Ferruginibacter sp.]
MNEDNLDEIKAFIESTRKVEKEIEKVHKEGKAEALEIGRKWDGAKNEFLKIVADLKTPIQNKYSEICLDVAKRQQQQEQERQRVADIKNGIEQNAISFAKQIAEAETSETLTNIERMVNLEKGKANKYMEFHEDAVKRFNELNKILADQKVTVRQLEENLRKQKEAEKANDDAALLKLREQQELQQAKIEEVKVVVQEAAINQSINDTAEVVEVILTTVKAKRTTWKYRLVDIKKTLKEMNGWVNLELDEAKVDDYLKAKRAEGITGDKFTFAGVEFYEEKTY